MFWILRGVCAGIEGSWDSAEPPRDRHLKVRTACAQDSQNRLDMSPNNNTQDHGRKTRSTLTHMQLEIKVGTYPALLSQRDVAFTKVKEADNLSAKCLPESTGTVPRDISCRQRELHLKTACLLQHSLRHERA